MTRIRLPFVQAFPDRHGRPRYYFRRTGCKRVPLPGVPGSEGFMTAYQAALGGDPMPTPIGIGRSGPGTVAAAVAGYLGSAAFAGLAEYSQRLRRSVLERLRAEYGNKKIADMERRHVIALIDSKAGKPGAAQNLLAGLRALIRYAIDVQMRTDDPTLGVRAPKLGKNSGYYSWTDEDCAAFEAQHPIGSKARLAFALAIFTAQRRAELTRLTWQHIRGGAIHLRQRKTGKPLVIPIHPELQAVLDATQVVGSHTLLVARNGQPYQDESFSDWFSAQCDKAGLPPRASIHGLRIAACRRLAEAGMSEKVIASISGHASIREVARYTRAADQARLAQQGIEAITRTVKVSNLGGRSVKPRTK
jgi:integrase